jgi:hypothetical protein
LTLQPQPVFLHIGAMKTGTTFLQQLLTANRNNLPGAGYFFPGGASSRQLRAVQDGLGRTRGDPRIRAETRGAWAALAQEMQGHPELASIVSVESLSFATPAQARRIVRLLEPLDVHVVLTIRDFLAVLPSYWQTMVHDGSTVSWADYMLGIRKLSGLQGRLGRLSPEPVVRAFSRALRIPRMLDAWGSAVPTDRLYVVTVPPAGSDFRHLWNRFAAAVGVDPASCPHPPVRTNPSLGHASTEFLRRVNQVLGRLHPTDYTPTLKAYLALRVLSGRDEGRAQLDLATAEFAVAWNRQVRAAVTASGAALIGDIEDLPVALPEGQSVPATPSSPDEREVLAAGMAALHGMHELVRRRARRLHKAGVAVSAGPKEDTVASIERWAAAADPVSAAATDVAEMARIAITLHQRIRALR